jgi:hypothetical protein
LTQTAFHWHHLRIYRIEAMAAKPDQDGQRGRQGLRERASPLCKGGGA